MSLFNSNQSSSSAPPEATSPAPEGRGILTCPYPLCAKAAAFRAAHPDCSARAVHSPGFGANRLGLNAVNIREAIDCLGFNWIPEVSALAVSTAAAAAATASGDSEEPERRLTLAICVAKNNPSLSGPGCLIMRPFVDPMHELCSKWLLVRSLRRLESRLRLAGRVFATGSGRAFDHEEFTAFTVNLNDPKLEQKLAQQPGLYLAKPARGTMGQRQKLVNFRPDQVQKDLLDLLLGSQFRNMQRSHVILQRYIDPPLLIDKRKFDMRVYYMLLNTRRSQGRPGDSPESGYFAFLHPGFVRLCTAPYDATRIWDLSVHLTNQSVQARHTSTFAELKEVTTWYPDELNRYLNRRHRPDVPRNWARDVLYPKIGAILGYVSALYRRHLEDRGFPAGTFRVLGVDMLVDARLRVHLLEFNEFPAWGRQTSVLQVIKPDLWREAACLVSEVSERFRRRQPISEQLLVTRENFRLIYSSEDPGLVRRSITQLYHD